MKFNSTSSVLAIVAMMSATGMAYAGGSSTFDAAVSVLSPDQTGFIIGGQVSVNGLGSGAVTLSRSAAEMAVTGNATSVLDPVGSYLKGVISTSDITSALNFSRDITTAGSLVGQGSVTARGEAIGSMGTAGAATANTTTAGTRATSGGVDGGEGSASAASTSQGSLNGSLSTANTLQLLGTSGLFAGSNGLDVGETNQAIAYGSSNVTADGVTGIDLATANLSAGPGLQTATGQGALFNISSSLIGAGGSTINLSVSNAGNGTVALTTSTGGFFTGGGAAGGSATHVDNGSFFNPNIILGPSI